MNKHTSLLSSIFLRLLRIAYIVFILCAAPSFSFSQEKYFAGNYYVENFGKEHGLPESVVMNVMQDRKGYTWISTPYFIVKYDGYNFKSYSLQKAFPDEIIHTFRGMLEDKEGLIWVMTVQHGVIVFDPVSEKFTSFHKASGNYSMAGNFIGKIVKDEQERIWFSTSTGLNLVVKDRGVISFKSFGRERSDQYIHALAQVVAEVPVLADVSKQSNDKKIKQPFRISNTRSVLVLTQGESENGDADFGWIENAKGDTVWRFQNTYARPAGGAAKNRLQAEGIQLSEGEYSLNYITDDTHAWNSWNEPPPVKPEWWGIQLIALPQPEKALDSLKRLEETYIPRGENIKELIPVKGKIYAITNAGIEILDLKADSTLNGELVTLPDSGIIQFNSFRLGNDALIIPYIMSGKSPEQISIGYYRFDITTRKLSRMTDLSASENPYLLTGLYTGNDGKFWVSRSSDFPKSSGLFEATWSGDTIRFHQLPITPPSRISASGPIRDQLWNIYRDKSGILWVASRTYGLSKIFTSKLPFTNIPIDSGEDTIRQTRSTNILEDGKGNTWFSYAGGNIVRYDQQNGTERRYQLNKDGKFLFNDNKGIVYASGDAGLKKFDDARNEFGSVNVKTPEGFMIMAVDSSGRFIAMKGGNEFRLIENGQAYPLVFDSSFRQFNFFRTVYIDRKNHFWISPAFEGVDQYRWDDQQKKLVFIKKYLRMGVDVTDIYEDKEGVLWIATYINGLVKIDTRTDIIKYYTIDDGLPSNGIWKIIPFEDEFFVFSDVGTFYFERSTGRVRKNNVLDYWIKEFIPTRRAFMDNGLSAAAVRSGASEISMISFNGITTINTADLYADTVPILLHIANLQMGKNNLTFSDSLIQHPPVFKYDQNDISIEYIGLYYGMDHDIRYAYRLEGANADWVNAGTDRVARFSNLPPGKYSFYLRVAQSQREWTAGEMLFSFVINPPWWLTWWAYTIYALVAAGAIWWYVTYRSRRLKEQNADLETRVRERTAQLNQSLSELKATQAQLVQAEKMASLGELTAGIAHEIQNPLNFVNNFSEVNKDLLTEMKEEIARGNFSEVNGIADDVIGNEEKINYHGKRADAIVKGMLQHSRTGSGQKESTDLNALIDEYIRLCYHGIRAKDNSFNATIKAEFDPSLPKVGVVPQDIGRSVLNLLTNAFYTVNEKRQSDIAAYEPTVSVQTKLLPEQKVEITIRDNGNGIPKNIIDKIFQPFFTTKPTGQGTGLGLSLTYDIIKAHGGELKVESTEGKGSEFRITLPV